MGKKRLLELLDQLEENQQQEIQNAATIYTVAQVAVNKLEAQIRDTEQHPVSNNSSPLALPSGPVLLSKEELLQRYGSYNACRAAAPKMGIIFKKTPSWERLIHGFSMAEALKKMSQSYLERYFESLPEEMKFEVNIVID